MSNVVIGAAWPSDNGFYIHDHGARLPMNADAGRNAALEELAREISEFVHANKRVFFVLGNPADPRLDPFRATLLGTGRPPARVPLNARQQQLREQLTALAPPRWRYNR